MNTQVQPEAAGSIEAEQPPLTGIAGRISDYTELLHKMRYEAQERFDRALGLSPPSLPEAGLEGEPVELCDLDSVFQSLDRLGESIRSLNNELIRLGGLTG